MALRPRWFHTTLLLSAVLVFSLLGIVSSGASLKAGGKVVSASLSTTSFTAAQAKTVKLKCKFSPATKRAVFLLQKKKGSKWVKVRSVTKSGSTKAYTTTVKALFGSKAVKVAQYRVKISADANSITRKFTVTKAAKAPSAPDAIQPKAGFWIGSGSDGVDPYTITFTVTSGGANVTNFGVTFNGTDGCAADGSIVTATSMYPVTNGSFSSATRSNPTFSGSFDSVTTARGMSRVSGFEGDCGDNEYGTASWTASWHSAG
jgi:hypothetical protein